MTLLTMPVNDNPRNDVNPDYRPGARVDADPLPPDATANDPRTHVYLNLRVNRVLDGGRCVIVETWDCYRGSASMPTGWIRPYQQHREPQHNAVYRFAVPIAAWSEKRRALLGLTIRRAAELGGGPHDAA